MVCRMFCEDRSGWSGGMPDLLLWRPGRGDAMLVEVKVRGRRARGWGGGVGGALGFNL